MGFVTCHCGENEVSDQAVFFPYGHSYDLCDGEDIEEAFERFSDRKPYWCQCGAYCRSTTYRRLPPGHRLPPDNCTENAKRLVQKLVDEKARKKLATLAARSTIIDRVLPEEREVWEEETVLQVRSTGTKGGINFVTGDIVCHCDLPEGEESLPPHLWEPLIPPGLNPHQGRMAAIMKHVRKNKAQVTEQLRQKRESRWDF
jgi:hypothetical protein